MLSRRCFQIPVFALVLGGAAAIVDRPPPADDSADEAPAGVKVTGHGEVDATPDIARIDVGVEARAKTASAAMDENGEAMRRVVAALEQAGIAHEDLKTRDLAVDF